MDWYIVFVDFFVPSNPSQIGWVSLVGVFWFQLVIWEALPMSLVRGCLWNLILDGVVLSFWWLLKTSRNC